MERAKKRVLGLTVSNQEYIVYHQRYAPCRSCNKYSNASGSAQTSCFFCKQSGSDTLHEAFRLDPRVRQCAEQVVDHELLSQLSKGDMRALDAKDHSVGLRLTSRAKKCVNSEEKI